MNAELPDGAPAAARMDVRSTRLEATAAIASMPTAYGTLVTAPCSRAARADDGCATLTETKAASAIASSASTFHTDTGVCNSSDAVTGESLMFAMTPTDSAGTCRFTARNGTVIAPSARDR